MEEDAKKIKFFQVYIGQTDENILSQSPDDTSCKDAKRELIVRLGDGTVEEETWTSSLQDNKDIVDLGAETEKLVKKAYPGQENTAIQQATEAVIHALRPELALKVQKLGCPILDDVVAATHKI